MGVGAAYAVGIGLNGLLAGPRRRAAKIARSSVSSYRIPQCQRSPPGSDPPPRGGDRRLLRLALATGGLESLPAPPGAEGVVRLAEPPRSQSPESSLLLVVAAVVGRRLPRCIVGVSDAAREGVAVVRTPRRYVRTVMASARRVALSSIGVRALPARRVRVAGHRARRAAGDRPGWRLDRRPRRTGRPRHAATAPRLRPARSPRRRRSSRLSSACRRHHCRQLARRLARGHVHLPTHRPVGDPRAPPGRWASSLIGWRCPSDRRPVHFAADRLLAGASVSPTCMFFGEGSARPRCLSGAAGTTLAVARKGSCCQPRCSPGGSTGSDWRKPPHAPPAGQASPWRHGATPSACTVGKRRRRLGFVDDPDQRCGWRASGRERRVQALQPRRKPRSSAIYVVGAGGWRRRSSSGS